VNQASHRLLLTWSSEYVFAAGIESCIPKPDARHELLSSIKLPVFAKDRYYELNASIFAKRGWLELPWCLS
jgi:hypothetical protein